MSGISLARNLIPSLKVVPHKPTQHVRCLFTKWPYHQRPQVSLKEEEEKRSPVPHHEIQTMDRQFKYNVMRYGDRRCFGVRPGLRTWMEPQPNGKALKKLVLAEDYEWRSFNEADAQVERISRALHTLEIDNSTMAGMFAETRPEWLLASHACFRANIPIVTAYTNLGPEGILRSFLKTRVKIIFTSADELHKIKALLPQLPSVTHVVYMTGVEPVEPSLLDTPPGGPVIMSLPQFEELSAAVDPRDTRLGPEPDDLATVMFTSGSSGDPKGVRILHRNLADSCILYSKIIHLEAEGPCMAYLPMAHIMELALENLLLLKGIPIAYSSPATLTSKSPAIADGQLGDILVAKPSAMCAVPLILERIKKSIENNMEQRGALFNALFKSAVAYKTFCYNTLNRNTPLLNWLLFRHIQSNFGGKLRWVASGSAALCPKTQLFLRVCLDIQLMSSFGATEVTACAAFQRLEDKTVGHSGEPLPGVLTRLEDWEEGGYLTTDKPHPRGELLIGGPTVTDGYFELNNDGSFFEDANGTRWFRTGDIGEFLPSGALRIIDRKKDVVKLQNGEFVSIAKVEGALRSCPEVENLCVVHHNSRLVVLVCPAKNVVDPKLSQGKTFMPAPEKLASRMAEHCAEKGLSSVEIPARFGLCFEEWTPESGLVTSALKIRRFPIKNHYIKEIETMLQTSD